MTRGTRVASPARRHQLARAATIATLALFIAGLLASSAQAAPEPTRTYAPGPFFGSQGTEPGQLSEPTQIAVEPGTGNLLVTDTGNARVQVFAVDSAGNPSYLTTLGTATLTTPVGITADPGDGSIYVSDSGAKKVFRFTSDGAPTPTYMLDATFTSPALASYASTLAVDPTTHDLLVADTGSQEVRRFDVSDGSQLSAIDGTDSPGGPFTSLRGLAASPSGVIYAVDEPYPEAVFFEPSAGRIESFEADGTSLGALGGIDLPGSVAADPSGGPVFAAWNSSFYVLPRRLAIYEGAATPATSIDFPPVVEAAPASLAVDPGPGRGVYALMRQVQGLTGIEKFKPAEIPAAEIGPSSAVTETTAHVSGSVAPGTLSGPGSARFEYSTDGVDWQLTAERTGITGPGPTALTAELTGLRPSSTYSVRIHVANEDFSAESTPATFTTDSVIPGVHLSAPTDRSATSIVLRGTVNPFGEQTSYRFEYGPSEAYGSSAPAAGEDVAGDGFDPHPAEHTISGLAPATTYHYRLVATNDTGTSASEDATFTTRSGLEPVRAYEQVTPVKKRGMVVADAGPYFAKSDGDGFVYQVRHAYDAPDTAGGVNAARYAALRSSGGWELRQLDVPLAVSEFPEVARFNTTLAVSADFSHALVGSDLALAPGGLDGVGNLYRRDLATGQLQLVASGLIPYEVFNQKALATYYAGSSDFSRILFFSEKALRPEAGPSFQLYEWTEAGGLHVASILPDGSAPTGAVSGAIDKFWPARQGASADAEHAYFVADGLYLREGGSTRRVSPPGGPEVLLLDTTPDGRFALYVEGTGPGGGEIYRFDRDTGQRVSVGHSDANNEGFLGLSDDGSSVFLGSSLGVPLTAWHEGATSVIAAQEGSETYQQGGLASSPNGRYFAFAARLIASDYDNRNPAKCGADRCLEVYLYDVSTQQLTCASCPADGTPSAGNAALGSGYAEFNHYGPPSVNDAGQLFFDTPTGLVAADSNGRRDVYEYLDGEVSLITPGRGEAALFAGASDDGSDVFFVTTDGLVGQDTDGSPDVYDARVGGGIPSQSPGRTPFCTGADCRSSAPPPAPPLTPASETTLSAPSSPARKAKAKHHRRKHHKKRHHHTGRAVRSHHPAHLDRTGGR